MSDTPETDAKEHETLNQKQSTHAHYGWKHARRLERERDEAREALRPVIAEIAAERQRQMSVEGWTPEHDDEHPRGTLATAAACYALNAAGELWALRKGDIPRYWPWHAEWWKPKDKRRDLIRAAALIVAEIERLDRARAILEAKP